MDTGRQFHDTKDSDASSRRNITLCHLEACNVFNGLDGYTGRNGIDGGDGHIDDFSGCTITATERYIDRTHSG
jgi:hypothetical protein